MLSHSGLHSKTNHTTHHTSSMLHKFIMLAARPETGASCMWECIAHKLCPIFIAFKLFAIYKERRRPHRFYFFSLLLFAPQERMVERKWKMLRNICVAIDFIYYRFKSFGASYVWSCSDFRLSIYLLSLFTYEYDQLKVHVTSSMNVWWFMWPCHQWILACDKCVCNMQEHVEQVNVSTVHNIYWFDSKPYSFVMHFTRAITCLDVHRCRYGVRAFCGTVCYLQKCRCEQITSWHCAMCMESSVM